MRISRLANIGFVAAAVIAAAVLAAPSSTAASSASSLSASTGDPVHGWGGPISFDNQTEPPVSLTSCSNEFHGHKTVDHGTGIGTRVSVDDISFTCEPGTSVTPHALPWTFEITSTGDVLAGVDVDVTTSQGVCRYRGDLVNGAFQFPNVYSITGSLRRSSDACGGTDPIGVAVLSEAIAGL
jgi:hypothetical protein